MSVVEGGRPEVDGGRQDDANRPKGGIALNGRIILALKV
jgi:hypothetical protein